MHRVSVAVLAVAAVGAVLSAGAAPGQVQSLVFQQHVFRNALSGEPAAPSDIGACVVLFEAGPEVGWLNVAATIPGVSLDPSWVVRNLRLHPIGDGVPLEEITATFPLGPLGIEPGMPVPLVQYAWSVLPQPLLDADASAWMASLALTLTAPCPPIPVDLGLGVPTAPGWLTGAAPTVWFPPFGSPGVDTVKSNIGCAMPNVDLNGATRANDVNACGPASCANSLKWLDGEHDDIRIPHDARSVMQQIERLAARTGPNGVWPKDLAKAKLDLIEAHRLPVHVKIQDRSSTGNISSSSGRTTAQDKDSGATSWPTRDFIMQEAARGEDVEVVVTWYYLDDDGNLKPSNYAHALVLTGAGTTLGVDWVKLKDDRDQNGAGGQRQPFSGMFPHNGLLVLPGLSIRIPDGPGAGRTGYPIVSSVISESRDTHVTHPPASERFGGYCEMIKRTVPRGGTITIGFPPSAPGRCFNTTLNVRDPATPGHDQRVGEWNFNGSRTRSWTNGADHPVVVMLHNDDKAHGQDPYPGYDVNIGVTDSTGAALRSSPFNPQAYGGFSLGGRDSSSAEFSPVNLGPTVMAAPIGAGFDLGTVPSRLSAIGTGTQDLWLQAPVMAWNAYWERLGLVIDVLAVAQAGDLLVECPNSGFGVVVAVAAPGRYELDLGLLSPATAVEVHLLAESGLDITLDAIGVPSLTPVDISSAPEIPSVAGPILVVPNPFNPRATLSFSLAAGSEVRLTVLDVRGRLVATLLRTRLPAGEHAVAWDGRDDAGRDQASGAYVARLEAGGELRTQAMTLIR